MCALVIETSAPIREKVYDETLPHLSDSSLIVFICQLENVFWISLYRFLCDVLTPNTEKNDFLLSSSLCFLSLKKPV